MRTLVGGRLGTRAGCLEVGTMANLDSAANVSFANPIASDSFDVEAPSSIAIEPQTQKALKKMTSDDYGLRTTDSDSGELGFGRAMEAFREYDADGGGTIDKEEFKGVLRLLGRPHDDEAVNKAFERMAATHGVDNVDEVGKQMFVYWFLNNAAADADDDDDLASHAQDGVEKSLKLGGKLLAPAAKLKSKVVGEQQVGKGHDMRPESWFLIEPDSSDDPKRKAGVIGQIHKMFESELLHLEDTVLGQADDWHWQEVWNAKASKTFDESAALELLDGVTPALARDIRRAIMKEDMPDTMAQACFRVFLKHHAETHIKKLSSVGSKLTEAARHATELKKTKQDPLIQAAVDWATSGEVYKDLGADSVPFQDAIDAVKEALEREKKFRTTKIKKLKDKAQLIGEDVPMVVKVEGLRGASSLANGTYLAAGLRQYWGRPVYVQHLDEHDNTSSTHFVMFFDQQHNFRDGRHIWENGVWVIAPSLNSERCTAWVREINPHQPLYYPPLTDVNARDGVDGLAWNVYDSTHGQWKLAPGSHCPSFSVRAPQHDKGVKSYYDRAVEDHTNVLTDVEHKLGSDASSFNENLRLALEFRSKNGCVTASDFNWWRETIFYQEELQHLQKKIELKIIHEGDEACKFHDDEEDNLISVRRMLDDYVHEVEYRQEERRAAKRRFINRLSEPVAARAFLQWKISIRSKVTAQALQSSGMFQEPVLPLNVRHPHSNFTTTWESAQVLLLGYIAFNLPWRLCFNQPPESGSFLYYFEYFIDVYFTLDVVMNFHTAYYDASGDLKGVKTTGADAGKADLKALYLNYCKGWMLIDVASVVPMSWIVRNLEPNSSSSAGDQLRLAKLLRFVRLLKLFRLVRGARIFKKYADKLGPSVMALLLVCSVILVLHSVTCVWFTLGTARDDIDFLSDVTGGLSSPGWIEQVFKSSDKLCACYSGMYYYDPLERVCVNRMDANAPMEDICDDTTSVVPSLSAYYFHSAFTVFQDPSVQDAYTNSLAEMAGAAAVTGLMGFLWGAVAGAWGTIFAANQMGSQAYRMRISQVKEFCRMKKEQLDRGVQAKLTAHYQHLYPENIIVDEKDILNDLPPRMREELVKALYGTIITSIPIFFGQDTVVLTELCLALTPLPALKGELISREGQRGYEMYCIETGICRVSQTVRLGDDVTRVKTWIEETFQATGNTVILFDSNLRTHLEELLRCMRHLARKKLNNWRTLEDAVNILKQEIDDAKHEAASKLQSTVDKRQEEDELQTKEDELYEKQQQLDGMVKDLTYKDLDDDRGVEQVVGKAGLPLPELLKAAHKQRRLEFDQKQPLNRNVQSILTIVADPPAWRGDSSLQMLCESIRDGVHLLDLLNIFLPPKQHRDVWRPGGLSEVVSIVTDTVAIADSAVQGTIKAASDVTDQATKATMEVAKHINTDVAAAAERVILESSDRLADVAAISVAERTQDEYDEMTIKLNLDAFCDALKDTELPFKLSPADVFSPEDVLFYNRGTAHDKLHRQQRVLRCLLSLAREVGQLWDYMGPKIDEVNLGTLGPGDFFGELALLPLQSPWFHKRTTTAAQNCKLFFLTKRKMELICDRFTDLRHSLEEHAIDYEATQSQAVGTSMTKNAFKTYGKKGHSASGAVQADTDNDPVAIVQEQLIQQEVRLGHVESQLSGVDAKL